MERLLAGLFVTVLAFSLSLGNFWFTYGIWPRNWWSFTFFAIATMINHHLIAGLLTKDKK